MTRVLITGSTGRLGGAFLTLWENDPRFDVCTLTRGEADLARPDDLGSVLNQLNFDILINPAAMSGLEECLDNPAEAEAINVQAPAVMAQVCREKGAKLVHFSTDYVFGGQEAGKKTETDTAAPVNAYGKTKLAGEQAVLNAFPDAIVARVSWLFGPAPAHRPTHFDHAITTALAGESRQFIDDKFSMPTFTHDVVKWIEHMLENDSTYGIYHLCNTGEPESWLSYAQKACNLASQHGMAVTSPAFQGIPISEASFFREQRPVHTAMTPTRLEKDCHIRPRHWLEAAKDYLKIR